MINLDLKWIEVNDGSKSTGLGTSLLIQKNSFYKLYIYSSFSENKRALIYELQPKHISSPNPISILGVRTFLTEEFGGQKGNLFVIEQNYEVNTKISEIFMSEIIRNTLDCKNETEIFDNIDVVFSDWASYFSEERVELTREKQMGLYAELFFLSEVLFKEIGITASLNTWKGPSGERHDFMLPDLGIEIKATRTNLPLSVKISNENQLFKAPNERLILVVFQYVVSESTFGDLPQIVKKIELKLSKNPKELNEFRRNLLHVGYNYEEEVKYTKRYSQLNPNREYYDITDDFPRLTVKELNLLKKKSAFMEISYRINLDACESHLLSAKPDFQ